MSVPMRWDRDFPPESLPSPARSPLRRRRTSRTVRILRIIGVLLTCSGLFALAGIGLESLLCRSAVASPLRFTASSASNDPVALSAATVERRLGFVTVTGSVISHAPQTLPQVEAVVELLDTSNHTVGMESGSIAFDPLPPSASSPFRVVLPDNAQAVAYRVHFRRLLGARLN